MKRICAALLLALAVPAFAVLPSTANRVEYTGNASTTAFTYTFKMQSSSDIEVLVDGVKQQAGFTVAVNASQDAAPGGAVTFATAPAVGAKVRVQRTVALTQGLVLGAQSAFPAKTIEKTFDRVVQQAQTVDRRVADAEVTHTADKVAQAARDVGQDSHMEALVLGIPGDPSALAVTATGSSVPRSLATRAAEITNVGDYCSIVVIDHTICIQDALDHAAGAVAFPVGSFNVTAKLTSNSDASVFGMGESYSIIIADHATPGTDILEIGPVNSNRMGVQIHDLGFQFKNGNTRNIVITVAQTGRFSLTHIDIHPFAYGALYASGAGIKIAGVQANGMNDWPTIAHVQFAGLTYGIQAAGINTINADIFQNTFASTRGSAIRWEQGGQSKIHNNTFQYSNLAADGTTPAYTIWFDGGASLSNTHCANITIGPGNSFQANGGQGLGTARPNTWDVGIFKCRGVDLVDNQLSGSNNSTATYGAFHAVKWSNSYGSMRGGTIQAYTRTGGTDITPGPVDVDATSNVSFVDVDNVDGGSNFTSTTVSAALGTTVTGGIHARFPDTTTLFDVDPVTGITAAKRLSIGGSPDFGNIEAGQGQLNGVGTQTVSRAWLTASSKVIVSTTIAGTPTEYITVSNVGSGSFTVKSSNASSAAYFYWIAVQ